MKLTADAEGWKFLNDACPWFFHPPMNRRNFSLINFSSTFQNCLTSSVHFIWCPFSYENLSTKWRNRRYAIFFISISLQNLKNMFPCSFFGKVSTTLGNIFVISSIRHWVVCFSSDWNERSYNISFTSFTTSWHACTSVSLTMDSDVNVFP